MVVRNSRSVSKKKKSFGKKFSKTKKLVFLIFLLLTTAGLLKFWKNKPPTINSPVCKHASLVNPSDKNLPDFSETDCEFEAYPGFKTKELDRVSCRRISQYIIVDKNNVYKQLYDPGSSNYSDYIIVKEADSKTFISLGNGYYKDYKNLYYDTGVSYKIIKNIDFITIQILSTHYIKDKNNLYFSQLYRLSNLVKIQGFDPETFTVIQNAQNHEDYFKDKNGVYFSNVAGQINANTSKIAGADIDSFEVLDSYLMAEDKNHVYRQGKIINGANPNTFEVLGGGYFKDNINVYTEIGGFKQLPRRDGCSFELIDFTNEIQWLGYSKDKNNVYYQSVVVEGADPTTFRVEVDRAFDKNYEYKGKYRVEN